MCFGEVWAPLARRDDEEYWGCFEEEQHSQRWSEPAKWMSYSSAGPKAPGPSTAGPKAPGPSNRVMVGVQQQKVNGLAIRCDGLTKRYGAKLAVDNLKLEVGVGQCFGLLGPNGAGKTTTVEMLEGLTAPDSGSIEVLGLRWGTGNDSLLRRRLGVQLQETVLADKLTVRETIRLFRSFYLAGPSVDALIELLNLRAEAKQRFHTLSGGQKQRVGLACALAGQPELLFLDEPTTGLDPRARKELWEVVRSFQAQQGTVLITTHYMEEAAALCDRIAIVDNGKIISEGSPAALVDSLGIVQFVEFELASERPAPDATSLQALGAVRSLEQRGNRYRLRIERDLAALQAVLAELQRQQLNPMGLSTHQATLDDVFLELTGRALQPEPEPDTPGATTSPDADVERLPSAP